MPAVLAKQVEAGNRIAKAIFERALTSTMKKPSAGWALRRNLWVHDVPDPLAFFAIASEYTLKGREHLISCPTFVCGTEGDDLSAEARTLFDKLTCPKEYVLFSAADDGSGHCEMSSRGTFHRRLFDWLDTVLPAGD